MLPSRVTLATLVASVCASSLLLALAGGCDGPPSAATLPEWTAADHDRAEETARATQAQAQAPAQGAPRGAKPKGPDMVVEAAWAEQCAQCHGAIGHGDGPTGPMVHAADLTRADWQASVTDEQLIAVIGAGKGKMPAFPNLPPKVVAGLVARIRAARGR